MVKKVLMLSVFALVIAQFAPTASACWDNTDELIAKLKKLQLNNEQLDDVFALHKEHKAVVKRAHSEGLGCRYHEKHDAVFEKKAIGVLDGTQFKKFTGRDRTKVEALEYRNRQLEKKIEKLEKKIDELEKQKR